MRISDWSSDVCSSDLCKCLARWRSAIWHADGGGELTPRAYDRSPEAPLTAPCLETKARGQVLVPAPKPDPVRTTRPRSPPSDRKSHPRPRRRLSKRFLSENALRHFPACVAVSS